MKEPTVLIVEDQAGYRRIFQDLLESHGYKVALAEDGEEGWRLTRELRPDLVLLDLGLPKMDGFEVLKNIRAESGMKDMPVVIFSVTGEKEQIDKAIRMGANAYMVKGFYSPQQILDKVKEFIEKPSAQGEAKASFRIPLAEGAGDSPRVAQFLGLADGARCPECGKGLVLEYSPDFVHERIHWFSARILCPQCQKAL